MSYENVIKNTKKIEAILVEMGAVGKGLHEKVSSIEQQIDNEVVKSIRFIASVRNKLLHEDNFELTDALFYDFKITCEKVINSLEDSYNNNSKKQNNDSYSYFNSSSADKVYNDPYSRSEEVSGWKLLGLGIAGAVAVYSWFNS